MVEDRNANSRFASGIAVPPDQVNIGKPPVRLRQLRYFVAAAEYGSFRKAAKALSIQESTVSRRIRDLEDDLGASLFHRSYAGVRLTVAGRDFMESARLALRQIDMGATRVASIGRAEEGLVKLGIFSSLASGFLFDILSLFGKQHPNVRVHLTHGDPTEHVAAVRNLELDASFITGTRRWDGCETERLWLDHVYAVVPTDDPLAEKAELVWSDIVSRSFVVSEVWPGQEIHDHIVARAAVVGHRPDIQFQKVGRDNLLPLVALGRGLTLICEASIGARFPGVVYRRLVGEVVPFCMVWSARNDNPASRRLLNLARARARL